MTDNLYDRDRAAIGSLQKLRFFPQSAVGGSGSHLRDADGRAMLDMSASWGAASLGYGHPALVDAVHAAISDQAGASVLSGANAAAATLAERLLAITPGGADRKIWFGHSGSDANETVFRAVVHATGRQKIIAFSGAYHGGTTGSMMISGHPSQAHAARSPDLTLLPYPCRYHAAPSGAQVLAMLDEAFATTTPPHDVAALFLEPIQSDGGLIVPPEGFLAELARRCQTHGILVVSDEVKIGLGRTGRLHGFDHEGFTPDIMVFGKGLGGGLPISAIVAPSALLDFETAYAMQTLHGNPVCAAAALAVLDTIDREGLVAHSAQRGQQLRRGLDRLAARHPVIANVRGRGLAIGIELAGDRDARLGARLVYRCHQLGLIAYYVGANANVIELTPPLILTEMECDTALAIFDQALTDLEADNLASVDLTDFGGW
jgi:4-aminobutyrate aminotransferase